MNQKIAKFNFSNQKSLYLIVIHSSVNNLYVNINDSTGRLIRVFSFAHVHITAVDHRKRTIFASEFGSHFGRYLQKLNLTNSTFKLKIKGSDPRCFAFIEGFIKVAGRFTEIRLISNSPHNGCRSAKRKRL